MSDFIAIEKNIEQKTITIKSSFSVSQQVLWDSFTKAEIMEKWWAPLPYKAIVIEMNFTENGRCLYYMLSPEAEKHWCIVEYIKIDSPNFYSCKDAFCDENGNINTSFPRMTWLNTFESSLSGSTITNVIHFETINDLTQLLEMGFEGGYKMGLGQLKALIES